MPSPFQPYQSGIEASTGNLVPAYSAMAQRTASAISGFGEDIAKGIEKYSQNKQEDEMLTAKNEAIAGNLLALKQALGDSQENAPISNMLNDLLGSSGKVAGSSLTQKRALLGKLELGYNNLIPTINQFKALSDENLKRMAAEGLANAPRTEKVVEDLSYKAGANSFNLSAPISVQRGKFAENLTKDAVWDDKQKVWISGTGDKIDLSLALKNWDAGAKETLRKAESAGNTTATVMLEQLNALAEKRKGEEYRANLAEGETTNEELYNAGRMQMRGIGIPVSVDTSVPTVDALNKLKAVGLSQENEQLAKDIESYNSRINQFTSTTENAPVIRGFGNAQEVAYSPFKFNQMLYGIPQEIAAVQKNPKQVQESIANIEALTKLKEAALKNIEQNNKELQQVQQAPAGATGTPAEAKASLSLALPKITVGTREKEIAISEEKTKEFARNWVTENMGITQTITNPDGTTRTIKVTPANFDSIYRTIKPTPKVVSIGGYDLLETEKGYEKLGETKGKGLDRAERAKQMKGTFGKEPIFEGDESRIYAPEGLIPEPLYVGTKEGSKLSGISLVGTYTGGDFDKFKSNISGLVQADSAIKRLIQISENPAEVTSFNLSAEAEALAFQIKAGSKVDLVGSQVTKDEWDMLDKYVVNPTKLFNMESSEREKLKTVLGKVNADIQNAVSGSGVTMIDKRASSGKQNDVIGQKRVDRLTGGSR